MTVISFTCPQCVSTALHPDSVPGGWCTYCCAVTAVPALFECPQCLRRCAPPEPGHRGPVACVSGHPAAVMTPRYAPPDPEWECAPCQARMALPPGHHGLVRCECGLPMTPVPLPEAARACAAYGNRSGPLQVTVNQFPRESATDSRGQILRAPAGDVPEAWRRGECPWSNPMEWSPGDIEL